MRWDIIYKQLDFITFSRWRTIKLLFFFFYLQSLKNNQTFLPLFSEEQANFITFSCWRTSFSFNPLAKNVAPSTGILLKLMSNSFRVLLCFKAFIIASDPAFARPAIWKRNFFKPTFSYDREWLCVYRTWKVRNDYVFTKLEPFFDWLEI